MTHTTTGLRSELIEPRGVMGKTASCQHDTAPRLDAYLSARRFQPCTGHAIAVMQEFLYRRAVDQRYTEVESRTQQAGYQCISVDEMHAAPMKDEIADVPGNPSGDMECRTRPARGLEEMPHVGTAGQAHAPEADQIKRRPQLLRP